MKLLSLSRWLRGLLATALVCGGALAQDTKPEPSPEAPTEEKEDKKEEIDEDDGPTIVKNAEDTQFSLDGLVGAKNLWALTPDQVETDYKKAGFRWLSNSSKDRGLIRPTWMWVEKEKPSGSQGRPSLSIQGQRSLLQFFGGKVEAEEVNFDFKNAALSMVTISVWNKGDSEDELNEKRFRQKIADLTQAMGDKLGVRSQDLGRDTKSASKAERVRWETPDTVAQLEHSSARSREEGFRAEFIRLRLAPKTRMAVGVATGNVAKYNQADLLKRVKKTDTGDVFVDGVPMVDQGEKGYCALATSERVMRYYGIECDQHDMAKASGGDAFGTDPEELQTALHKLQNRFKIRVRDLIHWDIKDYVKFTDVYNREAKRVGARQCPENYIWVRFRGLDKDVLREARTKGAAYDRFVKNVREFTGRGVPLLWGLELGIYPEAGEPTPQGFGGHMRLILGLNEKTNEIIFSDSWGAGHEFKRMNLKDAYVVTKGLYMIEPQR